MKWGMLVSNLKWYVVGFYIWSPTIYVRIFEKGKGGKWWVKRRGQKEHLKKKTMQTNLNLYFSSTYNKTFQNISVLILFVKHFCVWLCMCVTNTNTTKKDYLIKVSYAFWLSISTGYFFPSLIKFVCPRLEKVSPKKYNEEENGCME